MIVDLLKDFVDDEMVELQNDYLHLFIHKTYIINSKINLKKYQKLFLVYQMNIVE
jgi:hypothetical protein